MMSLILAGSKFQDRWSFFKHHDLGLFPRFNALLGPLRPVRFVSGPACAIFSRPLEEVLYVLA